MAYLALARKWRPKSFSEVVGQTHVVKALANALDRGRVHHAYLFTGTRGVGKTTLARIFAKSLNCEAGTSAEPCQQCSTCMTVDEGRYIDLIEIDAASRTKVDDTRELLEGVQYAPTAGKYKVYLIDEVHMLSGHSFNALLKTLEEPPEHVKFLFATTDPQKLPVTVLSRCLQFNLRAMRPEHVQGQLTKILESEAIEFDIAALKLLSEAADGSMRDGLSLLDQAIAQSDSGIREQDVSNMLGTIKAEHSNALLAAICEADADAMLNVVEDMADHAVDFGAAIDELLVQLYTISLVQISPSAYAAKGLDDSSIIAAANLMSAEMVQLYYQIALHGKRDIALAPNSRVGFEMAILRMLAFKPSGVSISAPPSSSLGNSDDIESSANSIVSGTSQLQNVLPASQNEKIDEPADGQKPSNEPAPIAKAASHDVQQTAAAQDSTAQTSNQNNQSDEYEPIHDDANGEASDSVIPAMDTMLGQNEWGEMVQQTQLQAMSRELAMNCACERHLQKKIELSLSPSLQHLFTPERLTEIEQAIAALSGQNYTVSIEIEESDKETPAECLQRLGFEQKSKIKSNISQVPGVQALMSEFDAAIVDSSIQPTSSK